ncbi:ankyrin repeat domain-containing protein [Catellatospora citrea]|uniref:ankyrin repeat domain-containing protein n=1 Tax=Catellatospora citrea TaxID=53366 RepID=UPI00340013B1
MTDTELTVWQRIRRHAVPPRMIAECTDRRLAGDWRGACAAGRVDTDIDLDEVARAHGDEIAERIEADLARFAPDLLRWHLPRALGGRTSLATGLTFTLAPDLGRVDQETVALQVELPKTVDGSQRLRLTVAALGKAPGPELPGYLWHGREAAGLRHAYGGDKQRLPFLTPDGTPVPFADFATAVGDGAPARAERSAAHLAAGRLVEAWREAGLELDETLPAARYSHYQVSLDQVLGQRLHLVALAPAVHDLTRRYAAEGVILNADWRLRFLFTPDGDTVRVRMLGEDERRSELPVLAEPRYRVPPDLELLYRGLIAPADLHPLVRAALFPDAPDGPAAAREPAFAPVRVRCRGQWHQIGNAGGRLVPLDHTPEEVQREQALKALGGKVAGCFAAQQGWTDGRTRLPRALRDQRRELMQTILHGDTQALLALLDAGLDPHVRDGRGSTLLHLLRCLDHEVLLPRLLAAGLPIDARDHRKRTPLHVAVGWVGTPALVLALLEAGADPRAEDDNGTSVTDLVEYKGFEYYEDESGENHRDLKLIAKYIEERT